jgi:hypothetical protein
VEVKGLLKACTGPRRGCGTASDDSRRGHKRDLANKAGGGGRVGPGGGRGKIDYGYWELYFTKESNLKEGGIGPIKCKFSIFFFLFAIIQFGNQKNYL